MGKIYIPTVAYPSPTHSHVVTKLHSGIMAHSHLQCTSVTAEDLVIDDCRNGEAVEAVCEDLPYLDVVPSLA